VLNCRAFGGVIIGAVVLLSPQRIRAQQRVPEVGIGRAAAQIGAGVLAMPIGFVGGGLATRWVANRFGATSEGASSIALAGAYAGAGFATAAGPTLVGGGPHASGSYFGALGGAVVGGVGSVALVRLNRAGDAGGVLRVLSLIGVVILPSVGATLGYNLTRGYRR
jgi:hypothetical protein